MIEKNKNSKYIYILLDPRKEGEWFYDHYMFEYKPFYVGQGVGYRCNVHTKPFNLNNCTNFYKVNKIKSILNNGFKPIIIKLVENLSESEADDIEASIIKHFGVVDDYKCILTNLSRGYNGSPCNVMGEKNNKSKTVYQYDLEGNFIKKWDCGLREIGRVLNLAYNSIADCCRNTTQKSHNYMWKYEYFGDKIKSYEEIKYNNDKFKKIVFVYDENILPIETFNSLTEMCIHYGFDKRTLSRYVATNKRYKGKIFSYKDLY